MLSVLGMIYTAINHKRIRGRCCGREIDFEVNIDSTEQPAAPTSQAQATPSPQEDQSIGQAKPYPIKVGAKVYPA